MFDQCALNDGGKKRFFSLFAVCQYSIKLCEEDVKVPSFAFPGEFLRAHGKKIIRILF